MNPDAPTPHPGPAAAGNNETTDKTERDIAEPLYFRTPRSWDGSHWTNHVHQMAAPSSPQMSPAAYDPANGFQPQTSRAGRRTHRGSRLRGANQASFTAIGVAALYVLVAVTTHFVLIGIVPLIASIRAVRRRERLAPLAIVAAAVALVVGISAFAP
jgi:Protein of unknown function (DUF2510)